MRINTDPLAAMKYAAALAINDHFARLAGAAVHRDHAHARKLAIAENVLARGESPGAFAKEAALRGLSVTDLASLVVRKASESGDAVLDRELTRQEALLEVEAATTPDELRGALERRGIGANF